jgi:uncharacterized membrane protein YfcA
MGGPPLVLYALAHDWDKDSFRVFLWGQLLLVAPVLVALLAYRTGASVWIFFGIGVAFAPLLWLGARLGISLTARWDRARVNRAAVLVLYALGLLSVISPLYR